jgi:hypothetical protein
MVVFYLRNSRIPQGKIVPITVALNLESVVAYEDLTRPDQNSAGTGIGFPNLIDPEGNRIWILSVSTTERDVNGDPIPPEIVNLVTKDTVHLELEAAIGRLGQKVDWGIPLEDIFAPQLVDLTPPLTQTTNVPITSNIIVHLQDPLPAAGIDISTISMSINGLPVIINGVSEPAMDVEFRGNIFDMTIIHRPKRLFS